MYLVHRTQQGDRWDLLAYQYYGAPLAYEGIVAANPELPISGELPVGVPVLVPVLTPAEVLPALSESLPPWLR